MSQHIFVCAKLGCRKHRHVYEAVHSDETGKDYCSTECRASDEEDDRLEKALHSGAFGWIPGNHQMAHG